MSLLLRFISFIARWAFNLLVFLLGILFRLLIRLLLFIFHWILVLIRTSFRATIFGPRQFMERLASEWTSRLLASGIPHDHLESAYHLCRFLAATLIVAGWLVAALFFVLILRVVFGILI